MKAINNIDYIGKLNKEEKDILDVFNNIKDDLFYILKDSSIDIELISLTLNKLNYLVNNPKITKRIKNIIKKETYKILADSSFNLENKI